MKEAFLSNLYFLLEQNGWTMTTLSIQGDIPYNTLSGMIYCNKNMPKLETIEKIANALGVSISDILDPEMTSRCKLSNVFNNACDSAMEELSLLEDTINSIKSAIISNASRVNSCSVYKNARGGVVA